MPKTQSFAVTADPEHVAALNWVLSEQQEQNPDEAPGSVEELVQAAFEGLVLRPYLAQMQDARVRRARASLNEMPAAERERLLSLIEGPARARRAT